MEGRYRRTGTAGFTLVEVLVAIAVLGAVGVAIGAISITGVLQVGKDSEERREDSTTAQWVSMYFGRDVQGAVAVTDGSACGGNPDRVITLQQSDGTEVEYRAVGSGPYDLVRYECSGGSSRTIVTDLDEAPKCDPACPVGETRKVTLKVTRTATFSFDLDAVRRPTTSGGTAPPPSDAPQFLSLGGDPLDIGGSSRLEINGAAYLNKPTTGTTAITINGSGEKLVVSGDFRLEQGATCSGCDTKANKQPGTYATAVPDPLRFLPAPSTAGLPTNPPCTTQPGGLRLCSPGIYTDPFPPVNGNVAVELLPGTYVLRDGFDMNNGSIASRTGGVLFYNESGAFELNGGDFSLSAASSGPYSGILLFQPKSNPSAVSVNGNATVASLNGTLYAPGSSGFVMAGSGASTLRIGRVIGASLSTSGSGTVIVNGAP